MLLSIKMSQQLHKNAARDFVDIGAGAGAEAKAEAGCFAALFLGFMRHAYYIFICEYVYNGQSRTEREREREKPGVATVWLHVSGYSWARLLPIL